MHFLSERHLRIQALEVIADQRGADAIELLAAVATEAEPRVSTRASDLLEQINSIITRAKEP